MVLTPTLTNVISQGFLPPWDPEELQLCPGGQLVPSQQHHEDKLQEVQVRQVPRGRDEARAGGRLTEEEARGEETAGDSGHSAEAE